jgi:hypothetical protein
MDRKKGADPPPDTRQLRALRQPQPAVGVVQKTRAWHQRTGGPDGRGVRGWADRPGRQIRVGLRQVSEELIELLTSLRHTRGSHSLAVLLMVDATGPEMLVERGDRRVALVVADAERETSVGHPLIMPSAAAARERQKAPSQTGSVYAKAAG